MDRRRLEEILQRLKGVALLVVGDFFLDKYLVINRRLSETSLETGLEAYQVVERRCSPGAAGVVTSNLRALGVKTVYALGVIGDDGNGYELKRSLESTGADMEYFIEVADCFTPTYTKPMVLEEDGKTREIERLDIKNRRPMPPDLEERIIANLRSVVPRVNGVIIADQVEERNCGVITDRVRNEIANLAEEYPQKVFFADSRVRIGAFRSVIIKPNRYEAVRAVHPDWKGQVDRRLAEECGAALFERNGKPVYVTIGEEGILLFTDAGCEHIPGLSVTGEIDPVGAGDSSTAGIVSALCAAVSWREAALVGNLVASITVQQIGTTGTASPEQVLKRFCASEEAH